MSEINTPKPGPSIDTASALAQESLEASQQRREAKAKKVRQNKIMRRATAAVVAVAVGAGVAHEVSSGPETKTVTVQKAGYLWDFANHLAIQRGMNVGKLTYDIQQLNPGIDNALSPGEVLVVPSEAVEK